MLPWNRKKNINIFHQEFSQASTPNRIINRLLDNDKYLDTRIESLTAAPIEIGFATSAEVEEQIISGKVISPSTIMSISATESDLSSGSDTRFVTVVGHLNNLANLASTISFIDITHIQPFEPWPSASAIEVEAKNVLGNYTPATDVPVSVVFRYYKKYTTRGVVRWGRGTKTVINVTEVKGLARYRYTAKSSGTWIYEGRIINDKGRLDQ